MTLTMTLMKLPPSPYHRRPRIRHCAAALAAVVALAGAEARAQGPGTQSANAQSAGAQGSSVQGVPNAVQGFSQNRDKPIQIDANSLEVRDKEKAATFKGDVKVVQGDTTMRCKTLVVFYEGGATPGSAPPPPAPAASAPKSTSTMTSATPGPTGSSSIRRLEAKGGVIVTQKEQTVTGDTGDFDMKSNTVTMNGNVVLTKGDNVLKGDRLIVDMTTGVSRVEMKNNGRVSGLFKSSNQGGGQGGTPSLLPGSTSTPPGGKGAASSPGKPLNLNELTDSGKR
ncbi:MAG: LptA/OstA family protein [Xanthobacteraceae bacterium]|nr:LptA/OstA family protein [Xanthobacteraceae bacterium]